MHLISQPDDKKSSFSVKLARPYEFSSAHRTYVGLKGISFPNAIQSQRIEKKSDKETDKVVLGVCIPYLTSGAFREIEIEDGQYTVFSLIDCINERIPAVIGPQFERNTCKLFYNSAIRRVEFIVNGADLNPEHRVSLLIFPALAIYLGLTKTPKNFIFGAPARLLPNVTPQHSRHGVAAFPPLMQNFELIMIYLDIVEFQVSLK